MYFYLCSSNKRCRCFLCQLNLFICVATLQWSPWLRVRKDIILSRKDWHSQNQFTHDTANGPDIDWNKASWVTHNRGRHAEPDSREYVNHCWVVGTNMELVLWTVPHLTCLCCTFDTVLLVQITVYLVRQISCGSVFVCIMYVSQLSRVSLVILRFSDSWCHWLTCYITSV